MQMHSDSRVCEERSTCGTHGMAISDIENQLELQQELQQVTCLSLAQHLTSCIARILRSYLALREW